jgi:ParB family chromosome partitioning protein
MRKEVFILNIDDILPNRFQPRIKFDEKAIIELSESIKKHGIIQPIIVRKIADKYEIIAGERRYKASVIAGRKTIPAIITDVDDKESAEIALIENVQRKDMTPIEEAISYKKILDMGYLSQSELAIKLGKNQSTIANKLRLLNLSDEVQEALLDNKISERHARSLLKLPIAKQPEILNKIINERLTVRKTDQLINSIINGDDSSNQKIKEEKGDNMNNNYNDINNNFNIPTQPIIDNSNPNPGFMNIDNIANNAQDITPVQNDSVGERQPFNPFGNSQSNNENPNDDSQGGGMNSGFNPFVAQQPMPDTTPKFGPNPFEMPQPVEQPQPMPDTTPKFGPNPFEMPQPIEQPQPMPEATPKFGPNPFEMPQPVEQPQPMPEATPNFEPNPFKMPQPVEQPQPMPEAAPNFGPNPFEMPQPVEQPQPMYQQPSFSPMPNYPLPESQELTPLMPETVMQANRVELNTVINTLRDCIRQIEGFGYKVDSDELDLQNTYEFTIKIDKQ